MLKEEIRKNPKQTCIPVTLTYESFCQNIGKVIQKHLKLTSNKRVSKATV